MKYICKEKFEINEIEIGKKGDILNIADAIPSANEDLEDMLGYCDITNLTTNQIYNATWIDVDDSVLEMIN